MLRALRIRKLVVFLAPRIFFRNFKNFFKSLFSEALGEEGQAATEYLLLVAVSLAIILVGVAVALELKNLSDVVVSRTRAERNATIAMLIR